MEPTLKFLCTLWVDVDDLPNEMPEWITFRVAGMIVSITMRQFCTTLGLYDDDEMDDLTHVRLTYALASLPYLLIWRRHNDGDWSYSGSHAHTSSLRSYAMRYLHACKE